MTVVREHNRELENAIERAVILTTGSVPRVSMAEFRGRKAPRTGDIRVGPRSSSRTRERCAPERRTPYAPANPCRTVFSVITRGSTNCSR